MSVTNSIIRIYGNAALTDLVTTVTDGADTDLEVTGLSAGTKYWATAQVTADGLTSEESTPYIFYTLPYIEFSGTMHTGTDWFSSLLTVTTTDVGILRWGIAYSESSEFTDPVYVSVKPMPSQEVMVSGLEQNTTYYARAFVTDIYGRTWVNPNTVTVSTDAAAPTIEWHGMIAIGTTSFDAAIKVASDIALTSVVCTYTDGVTPVTVNLSAVTGVQSVSLTGLKPNTSYSVTCTATNASGSASTSAATFTTGMITLDIKLTSVLVSNSTNIITVSSEAVADASCTITGHYIDLYTDAEHSGRLIEEVSGGANAQITQNLSHADPDSTYFVFGKVTYTIGSDPTVYTAWSEPVKVQTYSLFSFTEITPYDTSADVRYAVAGSYSGLDCAISTDQVNWTPISMNENLRNGSNISGLTPDTTYYLRGRCKSEAGWSDYVYSSFTTGNGASTADTVDITAVTYITETTATFTVTIS